MREGEAAVLGSPTCGRRRHRQRGTGPIVEGSARCSCAGSWRSLGNGIRGWLFFLPFPFRRR
eukprot:2057986-Prymnesium_polylepis.1